MGGVRVGAGQDQGELLAAGACRGVAVADRAAKLRADPLEHPIAEWMPVALIDRLEIVEVEGDEGEGLLFQRGLVQLATQDLLEPAVVGELGQRVGLGEVAEL